MLPKFLNPQNGGETSPYIEMQANSLLSSLHTCMEDAFSDQQLAQKISKKGEKWPSATLGGRPATSPSRPATSSGRKGRKVADKGPKVANKAEKGKTWPSATLGGRLATFSSRLATSVADKGEKVADKALSLLQARGTKVWPKDKAKTQRI